MFGKANEWNDAKIKSTDIRIEIKKKNIFGNNKLRMD